MTWLLYFIVPFLLGLAAQAWVKNSYSKWSKVDSGFASGAQVARQILDTNGLSEISIETVPGQLSDHYDPRSRTVRLSADNANSQSVAAMSVSAHEVGHAIQHAQGMAFFKFRSALAAPVGLVSQLTFPLLLGGIFFKATNLIALAAVAYALVVLFHLVTLPVEMNASYRARKQLEALGFFANPQVAEGSRNVLTAAAMTYVAAALAAIAQLMYFLALLNNR
jgi:uncharacterized protein